MALSYLRISDGQNEILFRCFILFVCVTSTFGSHQTFRTATSGNSNSVVPSASTIQESQDQIRYSNLVEETSSSNVGRDAKLKCLTSSQRRRTLVKSTSLTEEERMLKIQRIKRSTTGRRQNENRSPGDGNHIANVVYFDLDSDFLYYSHLHDTGEDVYFPAENFSVEMWVKPEGGQATGAVIAGKNVFSYIYISLYVSLESLPTPCGLHAGPQFVSPSFCTKTLQVIGLIQDMLSVVHALP